MSGRRVILHVDLDAFFASVEQRDDPSLRDVPVLVGSRSGRGVVLAASYEARPFGCRSAMPMARALRLCPEARVAPPRFAAYREASGRVFAVFERATPLIEPLSIDEAFLDVTGSAALLGPGTAIGAMIRAAVRAETGLTCSVGVASSKYVAKLASDACKPDGLLEVTAEGQDAFLDALPVGRVWGVGPKAEAALERAGVRTGAELRALREDELERLFGAWGRTLYRLARGIDERAVVPDRQAKGIGQEETFGEDLRDEEMLGAVLAAQVEHVCGRLRRAGLRARTITLKLRHADFATFSRGRTLETATDRTDVWIGAARDLFAAWRGSPEGGAALRLIGVRLSQFSGGEGEQLGLFDAGDAKQSRVDRTADAIRNKFGEGAITRAGAMGRKGEVGR